MGKLSLLKEYVELKLMEMSEPAPQQPFQLTAPTVPGKKGQHLGDYTIYREFPIVPTPEMMQALKVDESELDENGMLWGEHEIGLDVEMYYEEPERQTRYHPGVQGGYSVDDWKVVSFNGMLLSPEDAKALEKYLGRLTDAEEESLVEKYVDSLPEPDYDDSDYFDGY